MSDDNLLRIAREAADGMVEVVESAIGYRIIYVGPSVCTVPFANVDAAEARAERCRKHLCERVLAACEQALRQTPLPTPLTDERLRTIASLRVGAGQWTKQQTDSCVDDLLGEVTLLQRLLGDADVPAAIVRQAYGSGREKGFGEGALAQKREDAQTAFGEARGFANYGDSRAVAKAIENAQLVTRQTKEGGEK